MRGTLHRGRDGRRVIGEAHALTAVPPAMTEVHQMRRPSHGTRLADTKVSARLPIPRTIEYGLFELPALRHL
jgi:hypothetical protein